MGAATDLKLLAAKNIKYGNITIHHSIHLCSPRCHISKINRDNTKKNSSIRHSEL